MGVNDNIPAIDALAIYFMDEMERLGKAEHEISQAEIDRFLSAGSAT
jgi:hypothetical protein